MGLTGSSINKVGSKEGSDAEKRQQTTLSRGKTRKKTKGVGGVALGQSLWAKFRQIGKKKRSQ